MSEEIKYCDKAIAEALKFYEENYNLIVIPVPERETYIDTTNEYVCRFCGKNLTQTTFKMKAHAIPEFMGNKNLLSKNVIFVIESLDKIMKTIWQECYFLLIHLRK